MSDNCFTNVVVLQSEHDDKKGQDKMKKTTAFFTFSTFGLALAACTSDPADEGAEETATDANGEGASDGGHFIMAMPADAVTLDPHQITDVPSHIVTLNLYENLLMFDENMELEPVLAESYEQIDELTWEFQLREGIEFHDGAAFNAEAVVTNFDRFLDPDTASPRANLFGPVDEVEAVDEYTVHISTDEPFAPLLQHLAHGSAGILSLKRLPTKKRHQLQLTQLEQAHLS